MKDSFKIFELILVENRESNLSDSRASFNVLQINKYYYILLTILLPINIFLDLLSIYTFIKYQISQPHHHGFLRLLLLLTLADVIFLSSFLVVSSFYLYIVTYGGIFFSSLDLALAISAPILPMTMLGY